MQQITVDRRITTRRCGRQGGRRATDRAASSSSVARCPRCRQSATILAGEAEGGWWFVCDSCDNLWDQRLAANRPPLELEVASTRSTSRPERASGSRLSNAALSCWRFAVGRPG
jgi:hypothetical protein